MSPCRLERFPEGAVVIARRRGSRIWENAGRLALCVWVLCILCRHA